MLTTSFFLFYCPTLLCFPKSKKQVSFLFFVLIPFFFESKREKAKNTRFKEQTKNSLNVQDFFGKNKKKKVIVFSLFFFFWNFSLTDQKLNTRFGYFFDFQPFPPSVFPPCIFFLWVLVSFCVYQRIGKKKYRIEIVEGNQKEKKSDVRNSKKNC